MSTDLIVFLPNWENCSCSHGGSMLWYRIVVLMDYARRGMLIRFVGTHEQYDKIVDIEHI